MLLVDLVFYPRHQTVSKLVNIAIPQPGDANFARAGLYGRFPIVKLMSQIRQRLCLNRFDLNQPVCVFL
ncbi:hypothetical protein AC18_5134 [Escherichia coli 2-222-05_S3_C2]|nr:hypothetical protein AB50_5025 [Escherichia coli 6-175-07_S1_C2]KEJ36531.1 hypothetical protein AD31_5825 [Escherichia coli 2-427-07_S4_C3]KEN92929.1 hypothetical protein AC18_5134 [Escherichia coli 2-222-05_S3_C2]KEO00331.1 hypothetical protein AB88_5142 [Escherichia coli 2-222-05_S3_C1]CDK46312.1 hypothetical protein [Escherichia coli IS1]